MSAIEIKFNVSAIRQTNLLPRQWCCIQSITYKLLKRRN